MFFYYGDNKWKFFSIYFEMRPKTNQCYGENGTIMALELSHRTNEWILEQIKLVHGNLCSVKAEMPPL